MSSIHRRSCARNALRAAIEPVEPRRLLAAVSWDGGGDGASWNDPINWSNNALPTADDDVTLNIPGTPTILLFGTSATIKSLNSSERLRISTGLTVDLAATLGEAARVSNYASFSVGGGLTLNDVLTLGDAGDDSYGQLYLQGETDQTLAGTGAIATAGAGTSSVYNYTYDWGDSSGKTLTVGSGIEITGRNLYFYSNYAGGQIVNNGQLFPTGDGSNGNWQLGSNSTRFINNNALNASAGVTVNAYNLVNNNAKTIDVTDSTLTLNDDGAAGPQSWDNDGAIVLNNSTLNLGGDFTAADIGTLNRTGGEINLTGTLQNTASTFTINNTFGHLGLVGNGRIVGGIVNRTGANTLVAKGGTLQTVTLNLPVTVAQYHTLYIQDGVILNDVLTLGDTGDSSYGQLYFYGETDQALAGTGSILSTGETTGYLYNYAYDSSLGTGKTLTIGSGIQINGKNFYIWSAHADGQVVNNGQLFPTGDGSAGQWQLGAGSTRFINNNVLNASAGVTVTVHNLVNNPGKTINVTDSTLNLNDDGAAGPQSWDNDGTIVLNNSTLNLGGDFIAADIGTINRTGGQINITGTLQNTASTFTVNNTFGNLGLAGGGRVVGGTINRTGSNTLLGKGGTLQGVTLNLPVIIAQNNSLYIEDGIVLNDLLTLGDADDSTAGQLYFYGETDQTLAGTGSILSTGDAYGYLYNYTYDSSAGMGKTLNIGAGIEITGKNFYADTGYQNGRIANAGSIGSTVAGGTFQIGTSANTSFTNTGTLLATGGGVTRVNNLIGNLAGVGLSGAQSRLELDGVYQINAPLLVGNNATLVLRGDWTKAAALNVGGAVVFDYDPGDPSPLASLYAELIAGYNGGAWNGPGIASSRAAANPGDGVGIGEASAVLGAGGGLFCDVSVDASAVLLRYTLRGDADLDGNVDFDDLLALAQNYSTTGSGKSWTDGDSNFDGQVNFDDLLALAQNYGKSLPALAADRLPTPRPSVTATRRPDRSADLLA